MDDEKISVMQVTDSLNLGGGERMAVNLANMLPRDRFNLHLCSTRAEGPLADLIRPDVARLRLRRGGRLDDFKAIRSLVGYIRSNHIKIVHCHKDTVFLCSLASLFCRSTKIVWHVHYGTIPNRPRRLYSLVKARTREVIAVSEPLAQWLQETLRFSSFRVNYVRNFVLSEKTGVAPELPGTPGKRIVCVANVRVQKDMINLARAMAKVVEEQPEARALIVGNTSTEPEYYERVKQEVVNLGLQDHVLFLGARQDIDDLLPCCDIGVLSSASEGLPLSLIEYGMAGLASVTTRVGQCPEVLDEGRVGILVNPRDSGSLARAILRLLRSEQERQKLGKEFQQFVFDRYSPQASLRKVIEIYDALGEFKPSPATGPASDN